MATRSSGGIAGSPAGKSPSVVKRACEGDMTAARLILERIAPLRHRHPVRLKLPEISDAVSGAARIERLQGAVPEPGQPSDAARENAAVTTARPAALVNLRRHPRLKEVHRAKGCRQIFHVSRETHPARSNGISIPVLGSRISVPDPNPPRARMPMGVPLARALSGASGACAAPTARPAARATKG